MKQKLFLALLVSFAGASFACAEEDTSVEAQSTTAKAWYVNSNTDAPEPAGWGTEPLNRAIEKSMTTTVTTSDGEKMEMGRKVTKWISAPKFGGYVIGSYKYSSQEGKKCGDGFGLRLIRLYVDGTIFKDFNYRLQIETKGTTHVKDAFIEWAHWKEFKVKFGQFKRAFSFENPYNPWDVGVGDYSQLVKKLAGFSDYCGTADGADFKGSNGGRDIGLQFQGDLFPIGKDGHRLIHYQAAVYNGQGINTTDKNSQKDVIGTIQFQPIKDLYIGAFGWTGRYTINGTTVNRDRYGFGVKYEHDGWSARAEYAHHSGGKNVIGNGLGRADAWYATLGVPCTKWLKIYAKYDAYREGAWNTMKSIYSLCPNFQLHKNLMFQLQYNFVNDRNLAADKHNYHELWVESYVRF